MRKDIIVLLFGVLIGAFAQLFLKMGVNTLPAIEISVIGILSMIFSPLVFFGLFLYFLSTVLWIVILSKAELSYVYPFIGAGYGIVALLGWQFLGENLSLMRILGVAIIMTGVTFVSGSRKK